jgi:hypothetical protein
MLNSIKFHQKHQEKLPFKKKIFWSKLIMLAHSGRNGICPKLPFSLFSLSITMGQKYAKFG